MGNGAMISLPTKCAFCGKSKTNVNRLMIGIAVNQDSEQFQSCICDECLGMQMTALASMDPDIFEKLVETARAFKPAPGNSN
jgi:hypothetical protein